MTRDHAAAEIHALYIQQAKLYGWKVVDGPLASLPKDLQAMHYALADFMMAEIEKVKQEATLTTITAHPDMIASVLEALATVLRGEAKSSQSVGKGEAGTIVAPRIDI